MKLLDLDVALEQRHRSCLNLPVPCGQRVLPIERFGRWQRAVGPASVALITPDVRCTTCAIRSGKAGRRSG